MQPLLAEIEDRRWLLVELSADCRRAVRAGLYRLAWDEEVVRRRLDRGIAVGEPIDMSPRTWRYLGDGQLRISLMSDGVVYRRGRAAHVEIEGRTISLTQALTKEFMRRACQTDLAAAADLRPSAWPCQYHHMR